MRHRMSLAMLTVTQAVLDSPSTTFVRRANVRCRAAYGHHLGPRPDCSWLAFVPVFTRRTMRSASPLFAGSPGVEVGLCHPNRLDADLSSGALSA